MRDGAIRGRAWTHSGCAGCEKPYHAPANPLGPGAATLLKRGTRILLAVFFGLLTVWYGLRLIGSDGCFRWRFGCVPLLEVGLLAAAMGGILVGVGIWWLMVSLRKGMA